MHDILVALDDQALVDNVRTALKSFPGVRGVPVARSRLLGLLSGGTPPAAVIVDHRRHRGEVDPLISEIHRLNRRLPVLACGDLPHPSRFSREKRQLDVFSFIPLPLDPFDLLRRLHRLIKALPGTP